MFRHSCSSCLKHHITWHPSRFAAPSKHRCLSINIRRRQFWWLLGGRKYSPTGSEMVSLSEPAKCHRVKSFFTSQAHEILKRMAMVDGMDGSDCSQLLLKLLFEISNDQVEHLNYLVSFPPLRFLLLPRNDRNSSHNNSYSRREVVAGCQLTKSARSSRLMLAPDKSLDRPIWCSELRYGNLLGLVKYQELYPLYYI